MDKVKQMDVDMGSKEKIPCLCSQRWVLGYLGFIFGALFNVLRTDINIAIVCMAGDSVGNSTLSSNMSVVHEVKYNYSTDVTTAGTCIPNTEQRIETIEPEFIWDRVTQSHILSAYFYGFVVSQIPAGWFINKYGGKPVIAGGMAAGSVISLLTPVLSRTHVISVIIARVIVGLTSAPLPAAWISLVGRWALPNERSRMMMVFFCGKTIGAIFGYGTSGYLCTYGFDHGWGSIFYLHGTMGIIFVIAWIYFTSNSPETHPRITEQEQRVLVRRLHHTSKQEKFIDVPWREILTTPSVLAIFVTQLCDNSTYFLIVICLPLFAKEVLNFDVQSNGVYTALPFLTRSASLLCTAVLADHINKKRWVSRTCNRKLFQLTSFLGSAVFLVISSYIQCDKRQVVIFFICLSTFFQSIALSTGFPCNLVDMTPRYAPYIYSISNTIGASAGFMVPLMVAYLTQHEKLLLLLKTFFEKLSTKISAIRKTLEEWRFVFWSTAGIAILGSVSYGLFSTSEQLVWDGSTEQNIELEITVEEKGKLLEKDGSSEVEKSRDALTKTTDKVP